MFFRATDARGFRTFCFIIVHSPGWQPMSPDRRHAGQVVPSPDWPWARGRREACEQHGKNSGQEDAVERPCAANRGDRRAEPADLVEIEKVSADQRSHRAT